LDDTVTEPPPPAGPAGDTAAEVRAGVLTAVVVAALGVPVAAIWYAVAPRVAYRAGRGGGTIVDFGTQNFIAADGWFFVITAVAGVLTGVAAWAIGRRRAVGLAVGLAVGGIAAALIAWRLGTWFGSSGFHTALRTRPAGTIVHAPLALGAKGCLVAWPIAALVGLVVGVASEAPGGRRADDPAAVPPGSYGAPVPDRLPDDAA
jgi:hypothetical protein